MQQVQHGMCQPRASRVAASALRGGRLIVRPALSIYIYLSNQDFLNSFLVDDPERLPSIRKHKACWNWVYKLSRYRIAASPISQAKSILSVVPQGADSVEMVSWITLVNWTEQLRELNSKLQVEKHFHFFSEYYATFGVQVPLMSCHQA